MGRPYEERRELLESLGLEGPNWQTPRYHRGEGRALVEASAKNGLEGVVAKKLDSTYSPGRRSPHWIKVKNKRRVRLVVGGWLPEKERADRLGRPAGGLLRSKRAISALRGGSAPASTRRSARAWSVLLAPLGPRASRPSRASAARAASRYVEPRLVAEVEFTEWTNDGVLRHPSYKGQVDADPESIVLDPARGARDRSRGGSGRGQRRDRTPRSAP